MFPICAPVYVLQGSVDCSLRNDSRGSEKAVAAPQITQGYAPDSHEIVAPLSGTPLVAPPGNMLLLRGFCLSTTIE